MAFSLKGFVFRLLKAVAVLYLLFLVALNAFLNSGWLQGKINKRPEKLEMQFEHAWSLWPTQVHLYNWSLLGTSKRFEFELRLDSARATVKLEDLFQKTFHATDLEGEGFYAGFEFFEPGTPDPNEPLPAPAKTPWLVQLDAFSLDRFYELKIDKYRFLGPATLEGGFIFQPRTRLRVPPLAIEARKIEVYHGDRRIAHEMTAHLLATIDETDPKNLRGTALAKVIRASASIDTVVDELGFLQYYLQNSPLNLNGGSGPLHAELKVDRGNFLPGSKMSLQTGYLQADLPNYVVHGLGRVKWDVRRAGKRPGLGTEANLAIGLDEFSLRATELEKPHVQGQRLQLRAVGKNMSVFEPIEDLTLHMEVPDAQIPDLTVYNFYLPRGGGLNLRSGKGSMDLGFQALASTQVASGAVKLQGSAIRAKLNEFRLGGNWKLHTRLVKGDIKKQVFDLSGTVCELNDVTLIDTEAEPKKQEKNRIEGWWAKVILKNARYTPNKKLALTAELDIEMRDAKPLIQVFSTTKELPGFVKKMFIANNLVALGKLKVGQDFIDVSDFVLLADKVEIRARARVRGDQLRGVLYLKHGPLSVGVELKAGKTDLKLTRAKKWFEEYPPFED